MLVNIIKDYKEYKKNTYIHMCPKEARKIIKRGIAEEVTEYWVPGQLYVAELFTATRINKGHATEGIHERWAIVFPYTARIPQYYTLTETKYRHILTGTSFRQSHPDRNLWGAEGLNQVVVNSNTIRPFTDFFMNYMVEHDMDANTILLKEDIKKFEIELNKTTEKNKNLLQNEHAK